MPATSHSEINYKMNGYYIFLAPGYEPLEALAPMDVLRRAKFDIKFVTVGDSPLPPSTQGYALQPHLTWEEFLEEADTEGADGCLIFPGGLPGAETLGDNEALMDILRTHYNAGGLTCAICAAPARTLSRNIDVQGRRMTVYEGFEKYLTAAGAIPTGEGVTIDGNLITAKGPGLAIDFGLAILEKVADPRVYDVINHAMML